MKSLKNMLFVALIAVVLVAQIGYLLTIFKDDKERIDKNKAEIASIEKHVSQLEERVKMLPETEKELEMVTAQKAAMVDTIPTFEAGSKEGVNMMRYLYINDFVNGGLKTIEKEQSEQEDQTIIKRGYELSFVGRYEDVEKFIDNLNRSYQIINIDSVELSNAIQDKNNEYAPLYRTHYGADVTKLVEAKFNVTLFTRSTVEDKNEIYQPDFDMRTNLNDAFKLVQVEEKGVIPSVGTEEVLPGPTVSTTQKDIFSLSIGDIYTSGDTYKFGGPGGMDAGYVGMISEADAEIQVVIRNDGYEMSIKDKNGNTDQSSTKLKITSPVLNIDSTMRMINSVMPNVHIYVYNYTDQIMDVNLTGSQLGNIHVFNEMDQQVSPGQAKGNIRLTVE